MGDKRWGFKLPKYKTPTYVTALLYYCSRHWWLWLHFRLTANYSCFVLCLFVYTAVTWSARQKTDKLQITEMASTTASLAGRSDVTVAVGVALCVITVAIATVFIWHSSRHADCRCATFKMASVTVAPSSVVVAQTGNNNSAKLNTTTPSSGAILVPISARGRVSGRQQRSLGEPRAVIGRSLSRDRTGACDDVTSASPALHVSLNRLPLGDLLGPTNYIPYRLRQSYC